MGEMSVDMATEHHKPDGTAMTDKSISLAYRVGRIAKCRFFSTLSNREIAKKPQLRKRDILRSCAVWWLVQMVGRQGVGVSRIPTSLPVEKAGQLDSHTGFIFSGGRI